MATSPDYSIVSKPRITKAGFAKILHDAGSPAAGVAGACYDAIAARGVDPAVALAVFRRESTYGRLGRANHNRSWGNIRGGTTYPLDDGRFRIYPSWTAGAADCARLLAIYGHNDIRPGTDTSTVQKFPYVWAPAADGNAPDAYGDALATWMRGWIQLYPMSPKPPIRWWPAYLGPPPAAATFAIAIGERQFWQLDSAGNHVASHQTGGFSAYGRGLKTALGRQIGELITGAYDGYWIPTSTGRLYRRPG